jgi:serine/threonine-protein kinase
MNSKKFKLILGLVCFFISYSRLIAAPSEINYQGVLTDQQGNPVNGVRAMQIKLYDAPTGGNMTYQETIGNVTVADGIYSFKFGASGNGIASALNGNNHLALVVDSVEQPARTKILAVPYALKASESADVTDLKSLLISIGVIGNYATECIVTTLAGSGAPGSVDGTGTEASFASPQGLAVDWSGNVYVADSENYKIRKITPAGVVTTLAGSGSYGSVDGTGNAASFSAPAGVAVDSSGNVYVADTGNNKIRKITSSGVVSTLAGGAGGSWWHNWSGSADGTGNTAGFFYPKGIAVDSSGNVYVADSVNYKIRKITPAGVVTTLAGSGVTGSADGTGTAASFSEPGGVAVDSSGNVYVADTGNNKIRKITSSGVVTTLAGSGLAGSLDATGTAARFSFSTGWPMGVSVDGGGNIYVGGSKVRKITSTGVVTTLAGSGVGGSLDGTAKAANFSLLLGVAVDSSGNFYVADTYNNKIRKITIIGN